MAKVRASVGLGLDGLQDDLSGLADVYCPSTSLFKKFELFCVHVNQMFAVVD